MKRRDFFPAAGAALAAPLAAAPSVRPIIDLTWIRMRNSADQQVKRTGDFLAATVVPALKKAGAGPVGLFATLVGEQSPSILVVTGYPGLAAIEAVDEKLTGDEDFRKAAAAFYGAPGLPYQRIERSWLRAFDTTPRIEVPPSEGRSSPRLFELRTYESNTAASLRRKIKMFDDGEIAIFRKLNMLPVFFGATLVGSNMPNLTYMLAFDSLAAREKAWAAFGQDPDWQRMRVLPGLSDAEVVSNISNCLLRPLAGSDIR